MLEQFRNPLLVTEFGKYQAKWPGLQVVQIRIHSQTRKEADVKSILQIEHVNMSGFNLVKYCFVGMILLN